MSQDTRTARAPVTEAIERLRGQLKVSDAYAADANKDQLASVWQLQNANLQFILRDLERALAHPPAAEREAPGGVVAQQVAALGNAKQRWVRRADVLALLAAAPPPPANIGGDSPSERALLRERLKVALVDTYEIETFADGSNAPTLANTDACIEAIMGVLAKGGGT